MNTDIRQPTLYLPHVQRVLHQTGPFLAEPAYGAGGKADGKRADYAGVSWLV